MPTFINSAQAQRNRNVWLSVAAFLDVNPLRDLTAHARRIGAASAATAAKAAQAERAALAGGRSMTPRPVTRGESPAHSGPPVTDLNVPKVPTNTSSEMFSGELSNPFGVWVVAGRCLHAFVATSQVRKERRK